ncbi:hypothetical protein FOZ60_008153 [Perkinsus olseni]|uniref:Uncharacterized protein n=1 Tax=Perkinsus olseni TaxID=32597 RepID=A0A7J6NK24_PEROL|nr:hypothetical protein FOZ60_008153 [Perkinsus olseni]
MASRSRLHSGDLHSHRPLQRVLLSVLAVQVVIALPDRSLSVVADYPKGCHDGPGSEGAVVDVLSEGSYLYFMRGQDSAGRPRESAGIDIKTNVERLVGNMSLQLNVFGDTVHYIETPNISVETSGWAHLAFDHDDVDLWWALSPSDTHLSPSDEGYLKLSLPFFFIGTFPEDQRAFTGYKNISGVAVSNGMHLYADLNQTEESDVPFNVKFKVSIEKVERGWRYHIGYGARGSYKQAPGVDHTYFHTVDVAKGTIYG